MDHDVMYEVLRFFTRDGLEGMQLLSRILRDFVNKNSEALPLRYIKFAHLVSLRVSC